MSDEKKLVLSTQKSIHKPIEIEVDKKIYQANSLSRTLFDEIHKHEKDAKEGDIEALYKQVQLLYPISLVVLNKLDIRDIGSLIEYTMTKIFQASAKTDKEKAEKNAPKPGPNKSALSPASSQAS